LGSRVCETLHSAGHEVIATDLRHPGKMPYAFRVKNLIDREVSYELLEDGPEVIAHLGNHASQGRVDAQEEGCSPGLRVGESESDHVRDRLEARAPSWQKMRL
jgi:hypothetical protein